MVGVGKQLICCTNAFGFILERAPTSLKITVQSLCCLQILVQDSSWQGFSGCCHNEQQGPFICAYFSLGAQQASPLPHPPFSSAFSLGAALFSLSLPCSAPCGMPIAVLHSGYQCYPWETLALTPSPSCESSSWHRKLYAKCSFPAVLHRLGGPSAVFNCSKPAWSSLWPLCCRDKAGGSLSLWPSATLLDVSCRVQLDAEGSYQCSITGLIFEVTGSARITYSLLSWSKYAQLVEKPWIVGGPLFDVRCSVPGALSSIQFPHCLCLGGEPGDRGWEGPLGVF